jgi:NAD+ kinase
VKVALQVHPTRISDELIAEKVRPVLSRQGFSSYVLQRKHDSAVELEQQTQLILTIGGDGTFLHGAHVALRHGVPIIGVKVGRLGFLCSATLDDLEETIARIKGGSMPLEERHVLHGCVLNAGEIKYQQIALNDIVLFRSETDKLRDLKAYDNGNLIAHYRADGVILSTALGSTAYNMSAGGPLVHPSMEVIVLTPICAHSLFTKPLVLPPGNEIKIVAQSGSYPLTVSFDGEFHSALNDGDQLAASSFRDSLIIYRPENYDFYQVLRQKFQHGYVYGEDADGEGDGA